MFFRNHEDKYAFPRTTPQDRCLLAGRQRPVGRPNLSLRQSALIHVP